MTKATAGEFVLSIKATPGVAAVALPVSVFPVFLAALVTLLRDGRKVNASDHCELLWCCQRQSSDSINIYIASMHERTPETEEVQTVAAVKVRMVVTAPTSLRYAASSFSGLSWCDVDVRRTVTPMVPAAARVAPRMFKANVA